MLVLSRYEDQSIRIGDDIEIVVLGTDRRSGKVRLGIRAPKDVPVHRHEIFEKIKRQQDERTGEGGADTTGGDC